MENKIRKPRGLRKSLIALGGRVSNRVAIGRPFHKVETSRLDKMEGTILIVILFFQLQFLQANVKHVQIFISYPSFSKLL